MSLFSALLFLHVLSAIAAVGTNLTYRLLLAQSRQHPDKLVYTLNTVRVLDQRLANPAYSLLLVTGLVMALTIPVPLTTPWLLSAIILYVSIAVLGIAVVAPVFRRQIRLAESEGVTGLDYQATARASDFIGITVTALAVLIVFLMVTKPALWGN